MTERAAECRYSAACPLCWLVTLASGPLGWIVIVALGLRCSDCGLHAINGRRVGGETGAGVRGCGASEDGSNGWSHVLTRLRHGKTLIRKDQAHSSGSLSLSYIIRTLIADTFK